MDAPAGAFWIGLSLAVVAGGCMGAVTGNQGREAGSSSTASGSGENPGSDPPGGGAGPGNAGAGGARPAASGSGRLRLLTRSQFESSLRDLLGEVTVGPTEADTLTEGFASIGASYATISPHGVEQVEAAVRGALRPIFDDSMRRTAFSGCPSPDEACLRRFVTDFGLRAWRRPLSSDEIDRYTSFGVEAGAALADPNEGLLHTALALLTSPNFLYRVELGEPDGQGVHRYSDWEMASRLSYLLWNTTPDNQLLAAAADGKLSRTDDLRAEVRRLLASPRARSGFSDGFGRELTGLDALAQAPKNDPRLTPTLRRAMAAEVRYLFESRLEAGASLLDLLDSPRAYVDAELASLYGIDGVAGTDARVAELPADVPRAGLLGTGAFLTVQSKQDATSPTARGKFIREALLCTPVPDPPPNVDTTLREPPAGQTPTLRQHLELHRSDPACAACHALIDPLGYAFESFDWIGAFRDRDNGKPVDTAGELDGVPFADGRELVGLLRKLPDVSECFVRNLFRYASGHRETAADVDRLAQWREAFDASRGELVGFLAEVSVSDAFRTVSPAP